MSDLVDIVLPGGAQATVPKADLQQALAAGAHIPTAADADRETFGGAAGMGLSALTGAADAATLGGASLVASEGMGLLGGEAARKHVLDIFGRAQRVNPGSKFAGELGGLAAGGVGALGEVAETKAAGLLGEGLLGRMGSMGARTGLEGFTIGAQQQISEDVLGDHAFNGQAIFAEAAKDGLLGLGGGALLGAAGHYLGKGTGLLRGTPGVTSDAVLDELAGVQGAGRGIQTEAKATESLIDDLRKGGLTSEQAAQAAEGVGKASQGAAGDVADWYAQRFSGGNAQKAADLRTTFQKNLIRVSEQENIVNKASADFSERLTSALRNSEDTINEVKFTQKQSQFAKLVDATNTSAQRDQVAALLQETDEMLSFWEGTATKGGAEGAVKKLRGTWKDALDAMAKVENDATPTMSRDLFIKTDNLKRTFDSMLQWGRESRYGLPEAIRGVGPDGAYSIEKLADKFRGALEDEAVWGQAGPAQAKWNGTFSGMKARRDHLVDQLGVAIDQQGGIRIREGDFAKTRSFLNQLTGDETDMLLQPAKSLETFIDGMKASDAAIREFGELTPAQVAKLDRGLEDLSQLRKTFDSARGEAATVNRIKAQQVEEVGKGMGGLLGLVSDAVSRPYTTMERLARVSQTARRVTDGVSKALRSFSGEGGATASHVAPRAKDEAIREMRHIRELAANPVALEGRLDKMVGSLKDAAPKVAEEVKNTGRRAVYYLAKEAPVATVRMGLLGVKQDEKPRFSDTQVSEWEAKRKAALGATNGTDAPRAIISDMKDGRLNREAIKTLEFVSPQLFAHVQQMAAAELERMEKSGRLDKMPYQQKAAIAALLKVPADGTWKPDFIAMMQATKAPPPPPAAPPGAPSPAGQFGRKADRPTASMWMTEAASIETGGVMPL